MVSSFTNVFLLKIRNCASPRLVLAVSHSVVGVMAAHQAFRCAAHRKYGFQHDTAVAYDRERKSNNQSASWAVSPLGLCLRLRPPVSLMTMEPVSPAPAYLRTRQNIQAGPRSHAWKVPLLCVPGCVRRPQLSTHHIPIRKYSSATQVLLCTCAGINVIEG